MTAPIHPRALALIRRFEGYHRKLPNGNARAYADPVGVLTIGYGTTYYEGGQKVKFGDEITHDRAVDLLESQLDRNYLPAVDKAIRVPVHSLMRGACGSLAYNIGTAGFRRSTLARMINERRWGECRRAFRMWRYAGGRVLAGLDRRRGDEADLFMEGVRALESVPMPSRKPSAQPSWIDQIAAWIRGWFGEPKPA
jgi:lysozyme